jgi:molybdopterin-synthase adenylyltransferase
MIIGFFTFLGLKTKGIGGEMNFNYWEAFSRNEGLISKEQQEKLHKSRVAIAGLGGVGGAHLITFTRLGIGAFNIADLDTFGEVNTNRQWGADISTYGLPKIDVMSDWARRINPEVDVRSFPNGINESNLLEFLKGVDVCVDALDAFALSVRRKLYAACYILGIPVVGAGPMGFSFATHNVSPQRMSFEEYMCFVSEKDEKNHEENLLRFFIGIGPRVLHLKEMDPSKVNLKERKGPSVPMAINFCAGIVPIDVMSILLGQSDDVLFLPRGQQFDGKRKKYVKTYRPGGNKNPLNRLFITIAKRRLAKNK